MTLIVQKFGGTSVGSIEKIGNVADKVCSHVKKGEQVVVAVSAMSGETNRLIGLAEEMSEQPHPRELDVLVSTGEQSLPIAGTGLFLGVCSLFLLFNGALGELVNSTGQGNVTRFPLLTAAELGAADSIELTADTGDGE